MKYLLIILSLFMISCLLDYKTYETEAIRKTKKEVKCKEYLIALTSRHKYGMIVKVRACNKYYTWRCKDNGCGIAACEKIAVEPQPTEGVEKTK